MASPNTLRNTKIPLTHGSGAMPAVGFGTLIPDSAATKQATKIALEVGFRHFDCAERYRNEAAVGDALQGAFKAGTVRREAVFVTTNYGTPIWRALERLVDDGRCKSIGLSDVTLENLRVIVAAARIKPAVVQVESHPYRNCQDFCVRVVDGFALTGGVSVLGGHGGLQALMLSDRCSFVRSKRLFLRPDLAFSGRSRASPVKFAA